MVLCKLASNKSEKTKVLVIGVLQWTIPQLTKILISTSPDKIPS
jgi:hypothetical protein